MFLRLVTLLTLAIPLGQVNRCEAQTPYRYYAPAPIRGAAVRAFYPRGYFVRYVPYCPHCAAGAAPRPAVSPPAVSVR